MKINFTISGGFAPLPAFSRPFIVDTTQVDTSVAEQLETSVKQSRFFELPPRTNTLPKGAADYRTYTITVEDGERVHTIQITDPVTDPNLHQLVSYLQKMGRPPTS